MTDDFRTLREQASRAVSKLSSELYDQQTDAVQLQSDVDRLRYRASKTSRRLNDALKDYKLFWGEDKYSERLAEEYRDANRFSNSSPVLEAVLHHFPKVEDASK